MAASRDVFSAVREGSVSLVRRLMSEGVCSPHAVTADGQTLIFYAVQNRVCAAQMCSLLVESYGVDPERADRRGQTATFYLAKTGHVECLSLLARLGCDLEHKDNTGQTPVFYASSSGVVEMIRALFERGVDVNHRDRHGQTPLFYAPTREVFQALLNCGAQLQVRDHFGKRLGDYSRDGTLKSDVAEFAKAAVTLERVRGRLAWSYAEDGSLYAVLPAMRCDVADLCAQENEFIEDHKDMLRPMLPGAQDEELYKEVGLNPDPAMRRAIIQSITAKQRGKDMSSLKQGCTLKCVHFPSRSRETDLSSVVGYVYFKLRDFEDEDDTDQDAKSRRDPEMLGMTVFSHLKVDRRHQGRGCATLLLAGALKCIEAQQGPSPKRGRPMRGPGGRLLTKDLGPEAWTRHIQLSVIEQNGPARALYSKLGFKEALRQGSPVVWITMIREGAISPGQLAQRWLSLVPAPGGGCPCHSQGEPAQPQSPPRGAARFSAGGKAAALSRELAEPPLKRTRRAA